MTLFSHPDTFEVLKLHPWAFSVIHNTSKDKVWNIFPEELFPFHRLSISFQKELNHDSNNFFLRNFYDESKE